MEFLDAVQIKRHRLTVEQYHRMVEAGVSCRMRGLK